MTRPRALACDNEWVEGRADPAHPAGKCCDVDEFPFTTSLDCLVGAGLGSPSNAYERLLGRILPNNAETLADDEFPTKQSTRRENTPWLSDARPSLPVSKTVLMRTSALSNGSAFVL